MLLSTNTHNLRTHAVLESLQGELPAGVFYQIQHDSGSCELRFQKGDPKLGTNGATNESVIEVLEHRTRTLDAFMPCDENADALHHLRMAREAFERRDARRNPPVFSGYIQTV